MKNHDVLVRGIFLVLKYVLAHHINREFLLHVEQEN